MTESELKREIETVIETRLAEGAACPKSWVTTATINKLGDESASPFHRLTASIGVDYLVRKVLQSRKSEEDAEARQGDLFPGFQRLQRSYTIQRADEQVVVRLEQMTDEEILDKAFEKDAMAEGNRQHAAELRAYAEMRQRAVA